MEQAERNRYDPIGRWKTVCAAEIHWHEAHDIGAKQYKIKAFRCAKKETTAETTLPAMRQE